MQHFVGVLLLLISPSVRLLFSSLPSKTYFEMKITNCFQVVLASWWPEYVESVSWNPSWNLASDYIESPGAIANPLYDINEKLVDELEEPEVLEEAKNSLAMKQGPGKRGTRGLILKKLLMKGLGLLIG